MVFMRPPMYPPMIHKPRCFLSEIQSVLGVAAANRMAGVRELEMLLLNFLSSVCALPHSRRIFDPIFIQEEATAATLEPRVELISTHESVVV